MWHVCLFVPPIRIVCLGTPLPSGGRSPVIVHTVISVHSHPWSSTCSY